MTCLPQNNQKTKIVNWIQEINQFKKYDFKEIFIKTTIDQQKLVSGV